VHGPGYDPAASYYYAPTWAHLPTIPVVDKVANTLKPRKKDKWRAARDYAMAAWSAAGLDWYLVESVIPQYMGGMTDQDFKDAIIPGTLTLARLPVKYGDRYAAGGWWPESNPGSIVGQYIDLGYWALGLWNRKFITTHEMGHALGLKHSPYCSRTGSVMCGTAWNTIIPDAHDIESLRTYYNLGG
jgi:Dual-action HEIGH metallo-peptidase